MGRSLLRAVLFSMIVGLMAAGVSLAMAATWATDMTGVGKMLATISVGAPAIAVMFRWIRWVYRANTPAPESEEK